MYEQVPIIRERTQNRLKVHHLIPDGGLDDLIPPTNHTLIDSRKNERLFKKMKRPLEIQMLLRPTELH